MLLTLTTVESAENKPDLQTTFDDTITAEFIGALQGNSLLLQETTNSGITKGEIIKKEQQPNQQKPKSYIVIDTLSAEGDPANSFVIKKSFFEVLIVNQQITALRATLFFLRDPEQHTKLFDSMGSEGSDPFINYTKAVLQDFNGERTDRIKIIRKITTANFLKFQNEP